MGCCKGAAPPNELAEYDASIPDTTFMCLARMVYELTCTAESFYTGRERTPWVSLPDETCAAYAAQVRRGMQGRPPQSDDPLDQLLFRLLRAVTTHV